MGRLFFSWPLQARHHSPPHLLLLIDWTLGALNETMVLCIFVVVVDDGDCGGADDDCNKVLLWGLINLKVRAKRKWISCLYVILIC